MGATRVQSRRRGKTQAAVLVAAFAAMAAVGEARSADSSGVAGQGRP
jgi:hypothetical protein